MEHIDQQIEKAIELLEQGKVIGMPTETVYGLASDATSDLGCSNIFALKNRPHNNPLIVHCSNIQQAQEIGHIDDLGLYIANKLCPGPISFVVKLQKKSVYKISKLALSGSETICIRIPSHKIANKILTRINKPIAAPSANISNYISPTKVEHVVSAFPEIYVVDGGKCVYGIESTIIDLTQNIITILRYGFITPFSICSVLQQYQEDNRNIPYNIKEKIYNTIEYYKYENDSKDYYDIFATENQDNTSTDTLLKAPGMMSKHYSPKAVMRINAKNVYDDEIAINFGPHILIKDKVSNSLSFNLSESGNLAQAASNLYDMLRSADDLISSNSSYKGIAVAAIPNKSIGIAINDRLKRAAHKIENESDPVR